MGTVVFPHCLAASVGWQEVISDTQLMGHSADGSKGWPAAVSGIYADFQGNIFISLSLWD